MKDNLKKFLTNKDEIIKVACFAFFIGFLLMGASTTITSNIGSKFVNILSSVCFVITFGGILLFIFNKEIFNKAKINKKIIPKIIVAFLCLLASIILILISSNMVFNIDRVENAGFWLVALAMLSVSILVIVKQYLIDKKDWEEKPISAYLTLIGCMLYAILFAFIVKPDLLFKVFFTIHTVASLIAFVNTVFRYGIKAKNIWQISLFVLSVIALMALMIYSLYMWFWSTKTELFTSIMGVFAGLLGGIITLGGVAWTIKRQDDAKKEDEINKSKPYLRNVISNSNFSDVNKIKIENFDGLYAYGIKLFNEEYERIKGKKLIAICNFVIQQSSDNLCIITGIKINNIMYELKSKRVLKKDDYLFFGLGKAIEVGDFKSLQIIASDIYDNYYSYELKFEENGQARFLKNDNQKGKYEIADSAYFPDDFSCKKYLITDIGMPQKIDY